MNPIFGYTTCRSERDDKKIWHQRWRAQERTGLTGASSLGHFSLGANTQILWLATGHAEHKIETTRARFEKIIIISGPNGAG